MFLIKYYVINTINLNYSIIFSILNLFQVNFYLILQVHLFNPQESLFSDVIKPLFA